jgi:hypothetical protein
MELSHAYEILVKDNTKAFVQTIDGRILDLHVYAQLQTSQKAISVYPGSFNPLHYGHKDIFEIMSEPVGASYSCRYTPVFETSITRWGKSSLSLEELEERLKQFVGFAPIIITNLARFVDKTGLLRTHFSNIKFQIGVDTLRRMIENDYGLLGIQGIAADFVIHERITNGTKESYWTFFSDPYKRAINCLPGPERSVESMSISSTEIRNRAK